MGQNETMRLFAAIALPRTVRDHLAQALAMATADGRGWIPAANWHITLAFYGRQPEDMVAELTGHLDQVVAARAPFELALAGAGVFRHDVCWIGLSDPENALAPLAETVRGPYASPPQHAHNRFHVTVSRSGRQANLAAAMAALTVYRGPSWTVDQIDLYHSELGAGMGGHPLYTREATCQLGVPVDGRPIIEWDAADRSAGW